jgi:MFS family permease
MTASRLAITESSRWILLTLLVVSILVNYIDRGALSVSVPLMEDEFSLSAQQKGWLLSAFFWTYALMQLPAGWLVDRYDVKWVYAAGYLIWTIATAMTGWVTDFTALILARLLLGIGESAAYPAISRLIVQNYPEHQRGIANALVDAGSKIGPTVSTLGGGLFIAAYGWRPLFVVLGLGGLLWLIPWIRWVPSRSKIAQTNDVEGPQPRGPSYMRLLRCGSVWGTSLGMFALGYVWYFLLTWLPSYLIDTRGFDLRSMAVAASLPFLAMAASSVITGWWSDRLIASGYSTTWVRKGSAVLGFFLAAILIIAASWAESPTTCVALLVATCVALGMFTANVWAMTQTMAGSAAGGWTGLQNCIGNMGGVVSPLVAGWSVDQTGSYQTAFYGTALVMVIGILSYVVLVGPIKPVQWSSDQR